MRTTLSVLFFVLLTTHLVGAGSVRFATYNLQNYLVMDRRIEAGWRPQYPKPESEKARIREVILSVRPDILAVQEIGAAPFLEELRADLALHGLEYPYAIHMEGNDEVRFMGVLSMFEPVEVMEHRDLDFPYLDGRESVKRGLLELSFDFGDGIELQLFTVHLKSRWTDDKRDPRSELRRTREAEALREVIIERSLDQGQKHLIIGGDFNDDLNSAPLRRFFQRGALDIATRLPAYDSLGHMWTHYYKKQGVYSTVDGFLLSKGLWSGVIDARGKIVDLPGALEGSDHRLVYFDLALESIKE